MWNILFEEFAVRQMYWIFHEENSKYRIKKIIEKDSIDLKKCEKNSLLEKLGLNDIKYFTSFEKDPTFDLKDNKKFIEDLKNHNIYNDYKGKKKILILQGKDDDTAFIEDTYRFIKDRKEIELIELENVKHHMSPEEISKSTEIMLNKIKK